MRRLGSFVPTIGQIGGDFGWKTATVNKLQDLTHCRSYLTHIYSFDEVQGTEGQTLMGLPVIAMRALNSTK